jgi:hypothetical protein
MDNMTPVTPDSRQAGYSRHRVYKGWEIAMRKILFLVMAAGLWAAANASLAAQPITDVRVKLPSSVQWYQADRLSMGQQYFHLWLPKGKSRENTGWQIWVTRVALRKPVSAEHYARYLVDQFKKVACPSLKILGFRELTTRGHRTYAISYFCSEEKGKVFGSVTYERIAVQDKHGYVVHGEARILPSDRDRVLPLDSHGLSPDDAFRSRQQALETMVSDGVTLCIAGRCGD